MAALSDEIDTIKFVHTYGVDLHSSEIDPDVHDPRWQQRQVDEFVDFAVLAEELGFDGITVTEHHAPGAHIMRSRRLRTSIPHFHTRRALCEVRAGCVKCRRSAPECWCAFRSQT
jgi:alkanesulfonate monooxygenase SsuD/methylene tetrahydromethanopterin reductase-like flavin-dependent oxidoreductase (luciferase family)